MKRCDQCEMISVNGQACHEIGCPNTPVGVCEACQEDIPKSMGIHQANNWDGLEYCQECAIRQAEYEQNEDEINKGE